VENAISITSQIEERIVRYLLGELSPQDERDVEMNYLENDDYFEWVEVIEEELVRDYVRGEMLPDLRSRFEARCRSSAELAKKVDMAREIVGELIKLEARQHGAAPVVMKGPNKAWSFSDLLGIPVPVLQWAAVGGALAIVGLSLTLWKQNAQLHLNLGEVQRENRSLVAEKSDLDRALSERPKEPVLVASFILTPGLSRSAGNAQRFIVPAAIGRVDFKLPLPDGVGYPTLRAVLERVPDGQVSSQDLPPNALVDSGRAVVIGVPSASLRAGRYVLYLKGRNGRGEYEDVQYYAFMVAN